MTRWLVVALLASCTHAARPSGSRHEVDLDYTIALVTRPSRAIEISLAVDSAPGGTTVFDLGEGEWGVEHPEDWVRDLTISDDRGRPLAVEHPTVTTWTVRAVGQLELRYRLVPRPATTFDAERHAPFFTEHMIHLLGVNALIYPAHLADDKQHRIRLSWARFREAGWRSASSFGVQPTAVVNETIDEFRSAVFVASDELRVVNRLVGSGTLEVALVGAWPFADREIADLIEQVILAERAFFDDPGPPYFFVALIPAGSEAGTSGDGLTHSFAAFLGPETTLTGEWGLRVRALFAHEHFHTWNGQLVTHPPDDADSLTYWVTEGFTDFYTWRLLYRAGMISLADYVASINEAVLSYTLSPARGLPNAQIEAGYWRDRDVEKIPYLRGALIATALDRELARMPAHRGVDDVMRRLVVDARAGSTITTDTVLALFESLTSPAFVAPLRSTIVDGATLAIDRRMFEPCLTATIAVRHRFELGFDERSWAARRVIGLRSGSAAERAGLREGQPLTGISVWHDPDRIAEVTVDDHGSRKIEYLPRSTESFDVPTFAIADAAACRAMFQGPAP